MLKTAIFASAILFGASAPSAQLLEPAPTTADQTGPNVPVVDSVIAQFSYLEITHGEDGFGLSITDKTAVFVDVEFPGNFHIRIGF